MPPNVYPKIITGRVYLNPTNINGSGGVELYPESQQIIWNPGLNLEITREGNRNVVQRLPDTKATLTLPLIGGSAATLKMLQEAFTDDGLGFVPRGPIVPPYGDMPFNKILVIPDDPDQAEHLFIPQAQLDPDSGSLIMWSPLDTHWPEACILVAGMGNDFDETKREWMRKPAAAIVTEYGAALDEFIEEEVPEP